ncbi:O-Antigen ligase [Botrimarina colliarenosi]|uniref:O-Antigen ligase n=1 Tax=Botrimarina colliarenosi TaxID=2528001 RepID=A0A5C6A8G1_9BACT|nr:O-antigen ligase family protein [Botrimarina colliarenosi]TWT95839.1 O-Antigen ligase [Botrimarina colliarenosi]
MRFVRNLGVVFFLLFVFGVVEHELIYANAYITEIDEKDIRDKFIEQMESGNALRQVALVAFGAFGIVALGFCRDKPWNLRWSVLTPLLILAGLCLVSVAWSAQPLLTAKRLVVLACMVLGSAGLARMLTPRDFLSIVLVSLTLFIAGSLAFELAAGGRPWSGGDYRFGGTLHPNAQANYCGILCLAAVCHPFGFGRRWIRYTLVAVGLGLIVLTQSRTGLMSVAVALVSTWMMRLPPGLKWAGFSLFMVAVAGLFISYNSVGTGARHTVLDTALLGRTQQAGSLTGRVPLWEELLEYSRKKPLLGYGYEGFWTQDRIAAIMKSQKWSLQNAHNSYFEIVLQLGFVGLFFAVWFLLASAAALSAANRLTRDPGYAFAFGVLTLGVFNSLLESLFIKLRFCPTVALIGVLMVALFFPSEPGDETDASPTPQPLAG